MPAESARSQGKRTRENESERPLQPISTTDVGVAVFSETRNSKVMMENVHMSTPEPANDVNIPVNELILLITDYLIFLSNLVTLTNNVTYD